MPSVICIIPLFCKNEEVSMAFCTSGNLRLFDSSCFGHIVGILSSLAEADLHCFGSTLLPLVFLLRKPFSNPPNACVLLLVLCFCAVLV
jgi:hypothetical protein